MLFFWHCRWHPAGNKLAVVGKEKFSVCYIRNPNLKRTHENINDEE